MNNKLCTVGSMMSKKSWWKWALFGLLGLYALLLVSRCSPIEQDLQARTAEALGDKELSWATPALTKRGRDVMLSGEAPSEDARDQAIQTAANVYGVRIVENDITIKQYTTPIFGLNNDDGKTTLTGSFPEQGQIDQALRIASDNFGPDNVVNNMTVSEDVSSPSWLTAVLGVIPAVVAMKDADLDINNDSASLNGTFHTDEEKQSFMSLAGSGFGDNFTDNSVVVPLGPTPEELAEIARKAEEAETARLAEEKRLANEAAEVARIAEEKRLALEAEALRIAEEKRLAAEAEALRIANEKSTRNKNSMAVIMLAAQKAREAKAAAEAARIAEEKRLAAEAEAEAARIAEEKRVAAEAQAKRLAEQQRLDELARIKRLKEDAIATALSAQLAMTNASCQQSISGIMEGKRVLFDTSSATIDGQSYSLLDTLAERIRQCEKSIQVSGHTDNRGSAAMNMKLSLARAEAVSNYLSNQGIEQSVINSRGYGETSPVANNSSAAGRRLNRRIQFTILR